MCIRPGEDVVVRMCKVVVLVDLGHVDVGAGANLRRTSCFFQAALRICINSWCSNLAGTLHE